MNLSYLLIPGFLIAAMASSTAAQITVDGTTTTTLTPTDTGIQIDEGNRAGNNLFHSFQEFSVPNGGEAFFNNAVEINNIFSRVTGGNLSNIEGLIRANGSANLFLINPAGILFGEGAQLNIGGSFYGSTADSILFNNEGEFSAIDPDNPPILTINAPIGLSFRDNPAEIQVRGADLRVNPGQTLALLGGNVTIDNTQTFPIGANIELGGLSESGTINFDENLSLSFPENVNRADVSLTENSVIFVNNDGGGSIRINAANVTLTEGSQLLAGINNSINQDAQAGDITIDATETISLTGNSGIDNNVPSDELGNAGNIELTATNISLSENSRLNSLIFSGAEGNTGNLILNATESILLENSVVATQIQQDAMGNAGNIEINANSLAIVSVPNPDNVITSRILNNTLGNGNAGNITINLTDNILLDTGGIASQVSQVSENAIAEGNAGTIEINTGSATLQNRSELLSDTNGRGDAGNIIINATENILLDGNSLILSQIRPGSQGNTGNINISAGNRLISRNFSFISTNVQEEGIGQGGNLTISAPEVILTEGAILDALTENVSEINNDGGSITVEAQNLKLTAGGKIITGTDGNGNAGNIELQISESLEIDGANAPERPPEIIPFEEQLLNDLETSTGLFANTTENSSGNGGSINIANPTSFTIVNGGQVTVDSQGTGNGGSLLIQANSLTLDNQAELLAATQFGQEGPNLSRITLQIEDILSLKGDSQISAQAFNDANGGNINIEAKFVIAFTPQIEGNDIIANAVRGNGGNITIKAEEILGLQERKATPGNGTNDIDASSEFGFDGSVTLETPDVDAMKGIVELSSNVIQVNESFATVCAVDRIADGSNFIIKGRGGIPNQPIAILTADNILVNQELSEGKQLNRANNLEGHLAQQYPPIMTNQGKIYPARGLVIREDGTVVLTRYPNDIISQRIVESPANCSTSTSGSK
ncbi:MAG: filamentous hemagglutinin N-terminal domain-containing protein [Xenococcus sp. (in: cyanobacteria)]